MNLNPIFHSDFFDRLVDLEYEPFLDLYQSHLTRLNSIVYQSGEKLEGNIFYFNGSDTQQISSELRYKRRTLSMLATMHDKIIEIGFNAGHSALLMLSANSNLTLHCMDICEHQYTKPCAEYLKSIFSDRIVFVEGNSQELLPYHYPVSEFTAVHIDGGHMIWQAAWDLWACIASAKSGTVLLFDDSDEPNLRNMLDAVILSGKVIPIRDNEGQLILIKL